MIQVEDKFELIVSDLPEMSYREGGEKFKPYFSAGSDKELNLFLSLTKENKKYPLIWMVYPNEEKHKIKKVHLPSVTFILAVETNTVFLNKERFRTSYEKVLSPLFDNFREVMSRANNINMKEEIGVIKYPNYSNEKLPGNRETLKSSEQHKTLDVWDALKVTFNLTVTDSCYRKVILNKKI